MQGDSATPKPTPRFFTVQVAANLMGICPDTIYREIRAGRFPAIRVRGRYVVPAKAIDAMEQATLTGAVVDAADFVAVRAA